MRTPRGWSAIASHLQELSATRTEPVRKKSLLSGLVVPTSVLTGVGDWPKTCFNYKFYSPAAPGTVPAYGAETLGVVSYDPCTPQATRTQWASTLVSVCLPDAYTSRRARADLERRLGAEWATALWDLVGVPPTDSTLDGNIAAAGAEPRWTTWSDTGYEQQVADAPRRELLRRVLRLVVDYQEGVPEVVEEWRPRDAVVNPIAAGTMDYRIFAPWDDPGPFPGLDTIENMGDVEAIEEWVIATYVKEAICTGSRETFIGVDTVAASGNVPGHGSNVQCADTGCWVHTVAEFGAGVTFRFQVGDPAVPISLGSTHGGLSDRVWFGQIELDRCATAYDWLVAQAIRHFARSFLETDPVMTLRQLVAAQLSLRNALAVAAMWGRIVIHETCHNENLYHCQTGAACAQDHAAFAWWVHVTARLGLGRAEFSNEDEAADTGEATLVVHSIQDYNLPDRAVPWPGTRLTLAGRIECNQGTAADQDDIDALKAWGAVAAALAVLVGNPILKPALVDLSYYLVLIAGELGLGARTTATLEFAIDTPLVPGGNATVCCVKDRDPACVTGGLKVDVPCWSTDPPSGAGGCCDGAATPRVDAADLAILRLIEALSADADATHGGRDA